MVPIAKDADGDARLAAPRGSTDAVGGPRQIAKGRPEEVDLEGRVLRDPAGILVDFVEESSNPLDDDGESSFEPRSLLGARGSAGDAREP
jgi:hypothetical protein